MEHTKSPFDLKSCGAFVRAANKNAELLKGDWKTVLENAFQLSENQRSAMSVANEADAREVQTEIDAAYRHVSAGGKIRTHIATRSDGSHGLKLILVGEQARAAERSLVCCGADCNDWGVWCPDPPQPQ